MKFQIANAHFLRALREKWGVKTLQNGDSISVPFLTNERHFSSRKTGNILFYKEIYDWEKKRKRKTVPAENLIIQRMRCVLMPSCLVRFWELCTDLRSVSLHERNFPQDSRGKYGSKKAKYGTKPTQILDWISSVVTLWIWMINQIFA